MISMRKPNKNNEFLIEVHNSIQYPSVYTIYDMTQFFPSEESLKRSQYLSAVNHTVTGENNTVHIVNYEKTLSENDAIRLAIAWFSGETVA